MAKELAEWVETELLPTIYKSLSSAFDEFGWKKDGAKGWVATKSPLGVRADRATCNRAHGFFIHGDGFTTWLSYVNGGTQPKGADFLKAVRDLAKRVGLVVPQKEETQEEKDRRERREQDRDLMESVVKLCQKLLQESPEAGAYLENRGLPRDRWEVWELGFMPKTTSPIVQEVERLGWKWEEAKTILLSAGLLVEGERGLYPLLGGRVVAPWRGPGGSVLTWWGRDPIGTAKAKYLYAKDQPKTSPYLLDRLKGGRLLLVEGVLDAIQCREHGFPAVALGGTSVASYLPALKTHHPEDLTITVDRDEAGEKATPKLVAQLLGAGLSVFVVELPKGEAGEKLDPDALLRSPNGPETLRRLVNEAPHGLRWKARAILSSHRGEGWTDRGITGAIQETVDFAATVPAVLHPFINPNLLDELIQEGLPISTEAMNEATRVLKERTDLESHERETRLHLLETTKKVAKLMEEDKVLEARAVLLEDASYIKTQALKSSRPAPRVALEEWPDLEAHLQALRGRDRVGLAQDSLPSLDKALMGLRGLMLVAGPPNSGKTSIAVQLGLSALETDEEAVVVLVSLEQNRMEHLTRNLAYFSGLDWETVAMGSEKCRNETDRQAGTHFTAFDLKALKGGEAVFKGLAHRLLILDGLNFPDPTPENLVQEVENLKEKTGASRALVIVDYLQLWPVPAGEKAIKTDLDRDKWQIGQLKEIHNHLGAGNAVLAISEATKTDWKTGLTMGSVMGSARGAYSPDVVMVLQPIPADDLAPEGETDKEKAKTEGERLLNALAFKGVALIRLQIVKGRDGVTRTGFDLAFLYRSLKFAETTVAKTLQEYL